MRHRVDSGPSGMIINKIDELVCCGHRFCIYGFKEICMEELHSACRSLLVTYREGFLVRLTVNVANY